METPDDPQVQSQDLPIHTVTNDNPQLEPPQEDTQSAADTLQQPRVDDGDEGESGEQNTTTVDWVDPTQQEKKKKKRSKKSKSKRGKNKPTGFEEYYVDAPITPEQYSHEREIYDETRPIIHRMEDAILRFQKNRRIESDRREIFTKYLAYGGVDVGPKMFGGVDDHDLKEMDNEEILLTRGQSSIAQERADLEIDFNTVVKGYLTSYYPYYFNPESEDMIKMATVTIRNFLSYLMYHDVCPEHTANIDEARKSCDIAGKELWRNQQFTVKSPGDFNKASSTLFGGFFFDTYVEDDQWSNPKDDTVRMTNEIARKVVKFALVGAGTDEQAHRFQRLANKNSLRAMRIEDIDGFEVTAVMMPDDDTREFYEHHASDLHSVGRLLGKAYRDPGKPVYDLSPEERKEWELGNQPADEFEFFLEEDLLKECYPGMKVITSVFELNCGLHFFDEIFTAYSSVYTVLANDLMLGWKKPKNLVNREDGGDEDADGKGESETKNENEKQEAEDCI